MHEIAKTIMVLGVVLFMIGGFLFFSGKIPWLGKLPGDIFIKKGDVTFYFPVVTCVVLSVLLSLILMLWRHK